MWVDQQLSRLANTLQQMQRWGDSVFVVTGDHGEEFLEHGRRYHSPVSLPEELVRVPLILRAPILSRVPLADGPFSLIHLAPTLMDAVGVRPPESFRGRTWWQQIFAGHLPSEPAVVECLEGCTNPFHVEDRIRPRLMAVRERTLKFVINFRENKDWLYDLEDDPAEQRPLGGAVLREDRARLLKIAYKHVQSTSREQNDDLPLRARLREVKYSAKMREAEFRERDAELLEHE